MRFKSKLLVILTLFTAFLIMGCGQVKPAPAAKAGEAASVAEQAKVAGFQLVAIADVKAVVGNGVWDKTRGTIVDARPAKIYDKAHIPTAVSVPDTEIETAFPAFEALGLAKTDYVITYCGGVKCEKSLTVAKYLRDKGYTNVKMYLDGMPDWQSKSYSEVSLNVAKGIFDKNAAIFIDARPAKIFAKGTIPGAISIPDTQFEDNKANLPADKTAAVITFCGGFKCEKSHVVADLMYKMGYTNILVFSAGIPEWQKAGFPMAPGGQAVEQPKVAAPVATDAKALPQGDEPGIVSTSYFVKTLIDPATRPAGVTIVDVRNANELNDGVFAGSVNISSKDTKKGCDAFISELPKAGFVVFHCASGGRAMETYDFVKSCKVQDISRYYFLDAYVNCAAGKCTVKE